jgi:hypothetical protein
MICSRCHGTRYQTYEEDGRTVRDACYHCGNTGEVDEETDFHDRLYAVADTLARQEEAEYRKAVNEDPDGDGYDLCAAENMLHPNEYFQLRVWDRSVDIADRLSNMTRAEQELMVAWHELPYQAPEVIIRDTLPAPPPIHITADTDDEIPF